MFEQLEAALNEVKTKTKTRDEVISKNQKEIDKLALEIHNANVSVDTAQDKAREEAAKVQSELRGLIPSEGGRVRQS